MKKKLQVCPPSLKKHVSTTAAVDHNPSSTTASRGGEGWKNLGRQNMLPGHICLEKNYNSMKVGWASANPTLFSQPPWQVIHFMVQLFLLWIICKIYNYSQLSRSGMWCYPCMCNTVVITNGHVHAYTCVTLRKCHVIVSVHFGGIIPTLHWWQDWDCFIYFW